jgi:hypothetical protein
MNHYLKILRILGFCLLTSLALILVVPWLVSARGLVPCGGSGPGENPCTVCDIFVLIQNIINFIWYTLTIPLAILFFIYGGILLIVPGFWGEQSAATYQRGKKILTNTLIGIVIIFVSWLAIDTFIKLLGGKIAAGTTAAGTNFSDFGPWNEIRCTAPVAQLPPTPSPLPPTPLPPQPALTIWTCGTGICACSEGTPGYANCTNLGVRCSTPGVVQCPAPQTGTVTEEDGRAQLAAAGILVNKSACRPQQTSNCTNIAGLPQTTIDRLIAIKQQCDKVIGNCTMVVTGGTEPGHSSHGPGKPIVDLRLDGSQGTLNTAQFISTRASNFGVTKICTPWKDRQFRINCNFNETQPHIHVEMNG